MRIGILTLHDSINYGALLQAYALSEVYRSLGHSPVLIDRRRDVAGRALKWELSSEPFARRLVWFLGVTGVWHEWLRRRRTLRFLRERIGLTPYCFSDWRNAPADLGVDLISVGSDQVWNATIHDPLDYLPGRIPGGVPVISYAASLGMPCIPAALAGTFRTAVCGMKAVSVRESSSVLLLAEMGVVARHVVDPVILAGRKVWERLLVGPVVPSRRIFVYLIGAVDAVAEAERLNRMADERDVEIDFFAGRMLVSPWSRRGRLRLLKNLRRWHRCRRSRRFHLHLADGPEEFVRGIAAADAVITNSYHALLFAVLFGRNVRYVIPEETTPQAGMMVRIRDYAGDIVRGPLLQPSAEAAFASVSAGEKTSVDTDELERRRQESLEWIKGVL